MDFSKLFGGGAEKKAEATKERSLETTPLAEENPPAVYESTVANEVEVVAEEKEEEKPTETTPEEPKSQGFTASEFTDFSRSSTAIQHALISLVIFFVLAVLAYSSVFEHWPIIDSVYFATAIFTTVGYGDLSPTSMGGQIFTIVFALYGIVILGIFLGIVGDYIIERHEEMVEARRANARNKIKNQFSQRKLTVTTPDERKTLAGRIFQLVLNEAPIIILLILFASPICYGEGWSIVTSLYWITITATTIGFGDLDPTLEWTRLLAILYMPIAVAVLGNFLGRVATLYIDYNNDKLEDQFLARSLTLSDIKVMDTDSDGEVSRGEFLTYMLVALQKVEKEDIDEVNDLFDMLDVSKNGTLDRDDLMRYTANQNIS